MSMQQQPPAVMVGQEPFNSHLSHATIGPVIAVLVAIMILSVVAVMIGRVCSGRRILGYGQYDIESWAETKCSSCIDGRISPPLPRSRNVFPASAPPPASMSPHHHEETNKQDDDQSPQSTNDSLDS